MISPKNCVNWDVSQPLSSVKQSLWRVTEKADFLAVLGLDFGVGYVAKRSCQHLASVTLTLLGALEIPWKKIIVEPELNEELPLLMKPLCSALTLA